MNPTEELREELAKIIFPPSPIRGKQNIYSIIDKILEKEGFKNIIVNAILSKLKEMNYQKVIDIPGQAKLEGKTWEFCEPIDIGGTNEDK